MKSHFSADSSHSHWTLSVCVWHFDKHVLSSVRVLVSSTPRSVWQTHTIPEQEATACRIRGNKEWAWMLNAWNKVRLDCRHGWSLQATMQRSFPVRASCSKARRFPAHGHRVQRCESEQLGQPRLLSASSRGNRTSCSQPLNLHSLMSFLFTFHF